MKKIVIFKFEVFDESIKEIAMEVASKFPGVTEVVEVEGEGQLEVRGEFSISELKKELKNIDESVETIKIVPDGVMEPEIQQQDEGERPINIQKASKPINDGASSSNWTGPQENRLWEQVKVVGAGAAGQAKDIGVAAVKKALSFGLSAVRLLPHNRKDNYGNKNNGKEVRAEAQRLKEEEMERNQIRQAMEEERKRKQAVEEKRQKKIREEKEEENRRKQAVADEMKRQKKMKDEAMRRKQALADEEKRQKKIREEEERRRKALAEKEKIRQEKEEEKRRKQALGNNSGETSIVGGIAGSLRNTISTVTNASALALETIQRSTSTLAQRTGETSTPTHTQGTWRPSISTHAQGTSRPSTSTHNPYSSQRGNTTS